MDYEMKYELIPSDREGFYRVKALRDFNDVKKGDIGGYVESENNLSQLGDCWIYDNAVVRDNAKFYNNAVIRDNAVVRDNAKIYNNAVIRDYATVCQDARIWANSKILNYCQIYGNVEVCGDAVVCDCANVYHNARVFGNAIIRDNAVVRGDARIFDYVIVCDNADVRGEVCICGDAIISSDKDYIIFKNWWSSGRFFTWTRSNNKWKVGCFYGSGEELIAKAYKDSEESGREYECIVKYVERILNTEECKTNK